MANTIPAKHYCPLLKKNVSDKKCMDIGAFIDEGTMSKAVPQNVLSIDGYKDICGKCVYHPVDGLVSEDTIELKFTIYGVLVEDIGRPYSYLSRGRKYKIGDNVLVPMGEKDMLYVGRVVSVTQTLAIGAPYPTNKMKYIISKVGGKNGIIIPSEDNKKT